MKKRIVSALLALLLPVFLAFPALAETDPAGTYYAVSCTQDGDSYGCEGEYLLLDPNGGGEVRFGSSVFAITWSLDGDSLSFTDEAGDQLLNGHYDGETGTVTGTYTGYDYVYQREDLPAPIAAGGESAESETPAAGGPSRDLETALAGGSATVYPVSRLWSGEPDAFSGDYIVFNSDGSGMAVFDSCAYSLQWERDAGTLRFTDSKGFDFIGSVDGGVLTGRYRNRDCVYWVGDDAPILSLSPSTWGKGLPPVTDQADRLIEREEAELTEKAQALAEQYHCGVYIVVLDDMDSFSFRGKQGSWDDGGAFLTENTGYRHQENSPVETCAEEIRTGYRLGYGPDQDCLLLLLSMADRDYDLMAFGPFGTYAFTDYGRQQVADRFLDDFGENDWMGGFRDYLKICGAFLKTAAEGRPVDRNTPLVNRPLALGLSLLIGFLVGLIVCSILKGSMKSVKIQTTAGNYIAPNGVNITYRYDQYTHTTETRVYDPPASKSSGGGGGGSSFSSSGHSHTSGKF